MPKTLSILPVLAIAGLLSACANHAVERPDIDAEGMANPEVALQTSMTRIQKAMAALQATQAGARPVVPDELNRPIVWRFDGPLDKAAKAIAESIGYSYAPPATDMPAVMPQVSVNANGRPVIEVLRSLGTQSGDRATLFVDPDHRIVQVRRHV
ncbi:DotD/TraH family lipoprotein [Paeniroseomonas aquatica]|uniref:DotD/TraH family lipoprotein n=1 Tax=Paeniroseomonas aquatica TaxID=373043 RepID=A0ABT8A042_9PROT|nr:DotD/TraH family lipoprotein [Paeniroseomonas aquatica]MDN3563102.1 DotD/TraH family lipoprotein [Paeniroseomonas aquatica]